MLRFTIFGILLLVCITGSGQGIPDTLRQRLEAITQDSLRTKLYIQISSKFEKTSTDSAKKYARLALRQATGQNDQATSLLHYAKLLEKIGSGDSAIIVLNELIIRTGKAGNQSLQGRAFETMADVYYRKGDIAQALNIINNAIRAYQISDEKKREAGATNLKGLYYKYLASYDKALEQYLKALQLYDELGEESSKAFVYTNLGVIYKNREEYDKAIDFHKRSLELHRKTDNVSGMADCYNNLGIVYKNQLRYQDALDYYTKALEIWRKVGNQRKESYTLNNMAVVYSAQENYQKAMDALTESLRLKELTNDVVTMCGVKVNMAQIFRVQNKLPLAEKALQEALEISLKTGTRESRLAVYEELTKVYQTIGDYKKAFVFQKHYMELNDSLYGLEKIRLMNELEIGYLEEKADREEENRRKVESAEGARRKAEQEQQADRLRLSRNLTIALTAISILSLLLLLSVYYRYRVTKRNRKALEEKNRLLIETTLSKDEKELLLSEIHHRVKNNMQIISSMLRLQAAQMPDEKMQNMFNEAQYRINSMSLVHEELYKTRDFSGLDVQPYIQNLAKQIIRSFTVSHEVELQYAVSSVFVGIDTVIPLGLIVTEMMTNSMKHAFHNHPNPCIYMKGYIVDEHLVLQIGDNGNDGSRSAPDKNTTLGLDLIETLSEQLDATLQTTVLNGYHYDLRFRVNKDTK